MSSTTTTPRCIPAASKTKLQRTTFTTSRLMEFCSEKELVNQTGHSTECWPLVVLKELADNGPGIPDKTVEGILDYSIRVSSREAYVAPDRGAQGNALKTILAMPFVLSEGDRGQVDISVAGKRHYFRHPMA